MATPGLIAHCNISACWMTHPRPPWSDMESPIRTQNGPGNSSGKSLLLSLIEYPTPLLNEPQERSQIPLKGDSSASGVAYPLSPCFTNKLTFTLNSMLAWFGSFFSSVKSRTHSGLQTSVLWTPKMPALYWFHCLLDSIFFGKMTPMKKCH